MRMVCPACSAAYEVPESLLTAGRAVRCARCAHQWTPLAAPPEPIEPTVQPPLPAPAARVPQWPDAEVIEEVNVDASEATLPDTPRFTAMDRLALHRANVEDDPRALRMAWAASIVALLLLAAAVFVFRNEIAHVWPASQRLYDTLGVMQPPSAKP